MNYPKVSIMIPTYKQEKFILRAIESALQQDYPNLEIIISDDNSPDTTEDIVEEFLAKKRDARIRYFKNTENTGILRNYHKSLYEYTSGDWVINLDGDDFFIDPCFISHAMKLVEEDPLVVLVFGNYCEFNQATSKTINIMNPDWPRVMSDISFMNYYAKNQLSYNHNSIIYKRLLAIEQGFYWDAHVLRNDWESVLRLVIGRRIGYIKNISAAWVQHDVNETRRTDMTKYINNFALIKGVRQFAIHRGMSTLFVDNWFKIMEYRCTKGACIGYIRNRDCMGLIKFLKYSYHERAILPLKAVFDIGLIARAILAINPTFYTRMKALARKLKVV